jgi:hypothetical protein
MPCACPISIQCASVIALPPAADSGPTAVTQRKHKNFAMRIDTYPDRSDTPTLIAKHGSE